ncbi:MAG: SDR family NAD(P)-dependent oxidoreductase [Acidimicrobiales bacterium]
MSSLDGKIALITGGASGIGLATARRLRAEGALVVVVDVDEGAGRRVAEDLDGRFVRLDVAEPHEWAEVVSAIAGELGGIDIAYLNAGVVTGTGDLAEVSDEQYRRILRANVDGVFFGARAVVPAMQARGGGTIVATASIAGLVAYFPDPVYGLTKHAVVGLVRALAPQLQAKGITINAICPGIVDTPLIDEQARRMIAAANFPMIGADDIAQAVYDRVGSKETGQAWVVQVGLGAVAYRFAGVPGPRGESAGRTPPSGLTGGQGWPAP